MTTPMTVAPAGGTSWRTAGRTFARPSLEASRGTPARAVATPGGRRPTITVYGGGGVFGIAFNLGVGEAFVDGGVELGAAGAIGTSAGSWAATLLALGMRYDDTFAEMRSVIPELPNTTPGLLRDVGREVFGRDTRCPTVSVGVVALPRLRRHVLSGADHEISDLVAASSAVPGVLASHAVGRHRYIDGGVRAMTTDELGDRPARVIVVLPVSGLMFGVAGRMIERRTVRVVRQWEREHPGSEVTIVRPTAEIAGLVRRPDHLFDAGKMQRCYELAYEQGVGVAARWTAAAPALAVA